MQFFLYKPYLVNGEVLMGNCMEADGGEWVKIADVREALKPSHNKQSTPLLCRNAECDHCECVCMTQKCDYFKG